MKSTIKRILGKSFPRFAFCWRVFNLLFSGRSYLHSTGWMKSLYKGKPINGTGVEVPWMNYSIVGFLEGRLRKDFQLFEYGSGYSTSFYAKLVQRVTSLEYDKEWLQVVKRTAPDNVSLVFTEADVNGQYCRAINATDQKYDVVIIDGRDRANCIKQSIEALTSRGVILLDDSNRERYLEGIDYAKEKGFRVLDFEGLKPTSYEVGRTTLLYRPDNCFNI